ncbi:hypothetical protein D0T51_01430 [Parabacteroides sp. 52]|uniref:STM3941 family protein n=1 Tax=unclassified Parabacteroides TaxID=2649774 RepID=UPI0013CFEF2A|nr:MULTISPECIES: STM3941 family protein [unclassified Parabacteroides]MDH6533644.1 hypothetical protein [Parabacteroides sp. PM5-20]NDV54396.1 hypothetical protein [Parabacteroides sp. 52]
MTPLVIKFTLIKKKVRSLLLIALISAICGIAELYISHLLTFGGGRFVLLILGIVSLSVTLFCIRGYYQLYKEKFTAMYISDEGIHDISTGNHIGTVLWKDVEKIKIMSDISNPKLKYIVLKVVNPNEYISREISRSKKRTLELKLQYYGSPICFSHRALNCTFDQLKEAVLLKYDQYKKGQAET